MNDLINELESTKKALLDAISSFTKDNIDVIPFEGSWSGGQVMEHLSKSIRVKALFGKTRAPEGAADEKLPILRNIFLNYEAKFNSPEFIIPTETTHDREAYLNDFSGKFDTMIEAAQTLDLDQVTALAIPGIGELTRLEVLSFFAWHSQRHTRQLARIAAAF